MTREEAKEILQGSRITSFRPNGTARVKEALNMAIEALNERPTVIKCRMALLPEDFKVWAERIKENNPSNNIVVIPYDAEYVSGEERVKECE